MDIKEIRTLYDAMFDAGFRVLELENGEERVKICISGFPKEESENGLIQGADSSSQPREKLRSVTVKSERVGIFFAGQRSLKIGDSLKEGEILGIIKGISIQDQVISPFSGVLTQIFVASGDIVEYGKDLFSIDPR